ncbi:MAG TPA: DUF885 family protein, partial [Terracidiphilus sp.]|nr:DUF885 family protein [Terracidiphilus sp.]
MLKKLLFPALAALALALPCLSIDVHAQPAPVDSVADRHQALNALFHDYWESSLAHDPEFASEIGDKRYNDQIDDYSVKAVNAWLEQEQNYLLRLAAIDATGLSEQDQTSRELLLRRFADDQEGAEFKEWEMPVNQMEGIHTAYPRLVAELSFDSVKDYDDWIARLRALPHAFDQVAANMSTGMEDKRVPPKYLLEKVLAQVKELAAQKPEDSPLALPLKSFPATVPAAEQERIKAEMLDVLARHVLPAYTRFARF